jgi:hypothetical protein
LLHQIDESGIEEDEAILRVIDDVDDLIDEQAGIYGVANCAHARNAIIEFEMAVAVPGQGGDAIARLDAQCDQGIRQLRAAFQQSRVVGPVIRSVRRSREYFNVRKRSRCVG